jgi:hypothetical protein
VPFKVNQDRRYHIPRQRHRVTNWPEYDAALRHPESITVVAEPEPSAPLGTRPVAGA